LKGKVMKTAIRNFLFAALALVSLATSAHAQFAGIYNGPPPTPVNSGPALYTDQQNGVLYVASQSHVLTSQQTAIGVFSAQTAVTSVTTAQTLASLALNTNAQNVTGRTLRLCGYGIYTSPGTTAPTLTIAVTEGGITPVTITTAALSTTASTNMPFQFCFDLTTVATGATGTLEAHGQVSANISANTPAAAMTRYDDTNTAVSSAINLTSANTLALTVAASSTLTSVQLRQMTVELVK
jgi:hypothetical protein